MSKLFIIGNGFDIAHDLPTRYSDFRAYLKKQYPNAIIQDDTVPEEYSYNHGWDYDDDEVIGFIISVLDNCDDENWSDLESDLGGSIFDHFSWFFDINYDDDDEMYRDAHRNTDTAENISKVFSRIKPLFKEWVTNDLWPRITKTKKRIDINSVLSSGHYLNFNYTNTLELIYGVPEVCHIHGSSNSDEIYFGHGDEEDTHESPSTVGADSALNSLKSDLRKNTFAAYSEHSDFFRSLADVTEIYSYGFSFSPVDMYYIEQLSIILDFSTITWYFNKFDKEYNKDNINKIKKLGFKIAYEIRW